MTHNNTDANSTSLMPAPRYRLLVATVFMHGLLLLVMWLWWPSQLRQRALLSSSTQTIEVRLAAADELPQLKPAAQMSVMPKVAFPQPRAKQQAIQQNKPLSFTPIKPIKVRVESPATNDMVGPSATANDAAITTDAPTPTSSPIVGSDAQRETLERALKNKSFAEQANEQLGLRKATEGQAFTSNVEKAKLEDCLASNEGGSLLSLLIIPIKKAKGKCK